MLQPRPKPDRNNPKLSSGILEFWSSLSLFWDEDRINKWKNTIFPDGVGVESCFNLISLSPETHDMWNKGLFALKPLKLSRDRKTLIVQFFWQVPGNYEIDSEVDLLTETPSSKGLELVGDGYHLTRVENDRSISRICSGETFTFTTKDPKNLPLPSLELLEMQWFLQRLVGMSGAAGWPSLDEIDDDTVDDDDGCHIPDYTDYSVHNSLKRVREWVGAEEAADITPEISTATPDLSVIECR
jgi:hypothetical protein